MALQAVAQPLALAFSVLGHGYFGTRCVCLFDVVGTNLGVLNLLEHQLERCGPSDWVPRRPGGFLSGGAVAVIALLSFHGVVLAPLLGVLVCDGRLCPGASRPGTYIELGGRKITLAARPEGPRPLRSGAWGRPSP